MCGRFDSYPLLRTGRWSPVLYSGTKGNREAVTIAGGMALAPDIRTEKVRVRYDLDRH